MRTFLESFPVTALLLLAPIALQAHPGAGIVADAEGRVYFVNGNRIVCVEPSGATRVMIDDTGNERFYQLHHLFLDRQLNLYTAADTGSGIWKITPDGQVSRFFPPPDDDRIVLVGLGGDPFALDDAGNIFAINSKQNRFTQLLKINPEGRITFVAGGDWGHADGRGAEARFGDLHGSAMAFGPDQSLYLTDHGCCIRKVTSDGAVSTLAGGVTRGYSEGTGSEARFNGAGGLAVDGAGNVYVADYNNNRVRKVTPQGVTTTFAGSGKAGASDGPAADATFTQPTGVAFGPGGVLYVLEAHFGRVRTVTADGRVTTLLPSPKD
jgi:hypothetical protein